MEYIDIIKLTQSQLENERTLTVEILNSGVTCSSSAIEYLHTRITELNAQITILHQIQHKYKIWKSTNKT